MNKIPKPEVKYNHPEPTLEQKDRYSIGSGNVRNILLGRVMEYGSLITGIYFASEGDLGKASVFGFGYLLGGLITTAGKTRKEMKQFSNLENTLIDSIEAKEKYEKKNITDI